MKRFKFTMIFTLIAALVLVSCDKDFEEVNTDPNNPTVVPSHLLLPSSVRQFQNTNYSTFVGGELAGWAQQLCKVQYNDQQRYIFRQSVITSTWNNTYAISISDADQMYKLAEGEGNNNMMGAALVLQAWGYGFLTDIYGAVPFSEAMKADDGNFSPAYDSQEAVYTGIFNMLDQAMSLLGTGGDIDSTSDILYGGNVGNWKKFAASLKFRALMRVSGKMSVGSELQSLVNSGLLFTDNSQEARLDYLGSAPSANPLYESIVFGTRGEYKVNEVMIELLKNNNDPRLPIYAQKNGDGEYRGKPAGIEGLPSPDYNYDNVSAIGLFYLRPEAPGYFISNAELQFLLAEAAQKGFISGSAQDYYHKGIDASFAFNEISAEADAYKASNVGQLATNNELALQQIGNEKWKALYTQGVEAWTEQRRTGYPILTPAIDGEINEIPSRLNYPNIESSINKANYEAAVAAQGADVITTKLWWDN